MKNKGENKLLYVGKLSDYDNNDVIVESFFQEELDIEVGNWGQNGEIITLMPQEGDCIELYIEVED